MAAHPYASLPDRNFWKPSIVDLPFENVDPVISGKFQIAKTDKIVTAGSCFAQHIARHLRSAGFNYFVTEAPNPVVPAHIAEKFGYGIFTARYGNIYTSRQLLQLLQRAYGIIEPDEDIWMSGDGRFVDPFRPRVQPNGFASTAEYRADRRQHFASVRRAVEELDVFVFTLGLTETWTSRVDGAAYPLCPGVAGGAFDEERHAFTNLKVIDVVNDLRAAVALIREKNPAARFVFTVSPVPLIATAEPRSVLVSTTYSKAVLRVASEEVASEDNQIAYFPSYEIITGWHTRGRYFDDDLRSITENGVRRVMKLFFEHYTEEAGVEPARVESSTFASAGHAARRTAASAIAVICDEVALGEARNRQDASTSPIVDAEFSPAASIDKQSNKPANEHSERRNTLLEFEELTRQVKRAEQALDLERWMKELLQKQVSQLTAELENARRSRWRFWGR